MNPRHRSFGLTLGLAAMCHAFAGEFCGASPSSETRSQRTIAATPPHQPRETFTPEMRELVLAEAQRLKVVQPQLNAKARKKMARKAVLECAAEVKI